MLLFLAMPVEAAAQQPDPERLQEQVEECIGDEVHPYGPPSCTFDSEGNLVDRQMPGEDPGPFGFGGWVVLGLLWAAIPMVIGAMLASSRGQNVGLALLATLLLGWIGLLLIYLFQKPATGEAARRIVENLSQAPVDVADQIRKLGELRRDGLLTDEEFQAKKAQLLGVS